MGGGEGETQFFTPDKSQCYLKKKKKKNQNFLSKCITWVNNSNIYFSELQQPGYTIV